MESFESGMMVNTWAHLKKLLKSRKAVVCVEETSFTIRISQADSRSLLAHEGPLMLIREGPGRVRLVPEAAAMGDGGWGS